MSPRIAGALVAGLVLAACTAAGASTAPVSGGAPEPAAVRTTAGSAAESVLAASEAAALEAAAVPTEVLPAPRASLAAATVGPMKLVWQTLNNCGPAAVVMALSTVGVDADQETARLALRGPDVRRGMGPQGVGPWVEATFGLRSAWRYDGTSALLKALVSNGFAPMVTQWLYDPSVSRIAHWRTVAGYDDARGVFYVNDSMRGSAVALDYAWFDHAWQPFGYRYLVVYRPGDEPLLRAILGDDWSDGLMRRRYYERARAEAASRDDAPSWLAYGEAAYQNGLFAESVGAFEHGLGMGPADGIFTFRTSYPRALEAIGRTDDATLWQRKLTPPLSDPVR